MSRKYLVLLIVFLSILILKAYADMTVEDVVDMWKEGFGEEVIKAKIDKENATFELSKYDLEALKKAGVSDTLIAYMIKREEEKPTEEVITTERETHVLVKEEPKKRGYEQYISFGYTLYNYSVSEVDYSDKANIIKMAYTLRWKYLGLRLGAGFSFWPNGKAVSGEVGCVIPFITVDISSSQLCPFVYVNGGIGVMIPENANYTNLLGNVGGGGGIQMLFPISGSDFKFGFEVSAGYAAYIETNTEYNVSIHMYGPEINVGMLLSL